MADLKGTLLHLMRALFGSEREMRFRTHYFPFTEPSLEPDVSCFLCSGQGCTVCRWSGWIELGGSGMVDPNVLEFVGYDPEEWTGFAFGIGLERIAMLRHGLPEIGPLWQNDLRLLRQF
jgi:phenylalanyl-tRNA synthetase alpha chain